MQRNSRIVIVCGATAAVMLLIAAATARAAQLDATWLGGSGNWSNGSLWSTGLAPNNGGGNTYNVLIDNGNGAASEVFCNMNPTIDNLTVDANDRLWINNSQHLYIAGGAGAGLIHNAGRITINCTVGNPTGLHPAGGTLTLAGGGTLQMSNSSENYIYQSGGGGFINQDNTIQGSGYFGLATSPTAIENYGTVLANQANPLRIQTGGAGFTNGGTLRAASGGTLHLDGGGYANAAGLVEAWDASAVQINGGAVVAGGTFATAGSGKILGTGGKLDASTNLVINSGVIEIPNANTLYAVGEIENTGAIRINCTVGNPTYFCPSGGALTLTGGGTLQMSNSSENYIYQTGGGSLVNMDNTIQGSGYLGWSGVSTAIENRGNVIANQANPLRIQTGGGGFTNAGTLSATAGATLHLDSGGYANASGRIEAADGSTVRINGGATIDGGTFATTGTGLIWGTGGKLDGSVNVVHNAGLIEVPNNNALYAVGEIENAGTIRINCTVGNPTYLCPSGGALTLTGGGTLQLSNSTENYIYQSGGGALVNVDNVIQGSGYLGWSGAPTAIENRGVVVANQSTPLRIQTGGAGFVNKGTLRAASSRTLHLDAGGYDNAAGRIEALAGSYVQVNAGAIIAGGELASEGTGAVLGTGGALDGSTHPVQNTGRVEVPNNNTLYAAGTIDNTGTIQIHSTAGNTTALRPNGGPLTLAGGGTVEMLGYYSANYIYQSNGGSLVNLDNTIKGAGNLGVSGTPMPITNEGTVTADVAGQTMTVQPDGAGFTNTGTLRAENGGTLSLYGGLYDNAGGLLEALDASAVRINGGATIDGGTLASAGSGMIAGVGGALDGTTHVVHNTGLVEIPNGSVLHAVGELNNGGVIRIHSTVGNTTVLHPSGGALRLTGGGVVELVGSFGANYIHQSGGGWLVNEDNTIRGGGHLGWDGAPMPITNQGVVEANATGVLSIETAAELFDNRGSMVVSGTGGMSITGNFTTSGTVDVHAARQLTRSGVYTQTAGSTEVNGVLSASQGVDILGGELRGTGTVSSTSNAGTIRPGTSIGRLTISGNLTQQAAGALAFELAGVDAGDYDTMSVSGTVVLNGELQVQALPPFAPQVGDTFEVLTAASIGGLFSTFNEIDFPEDIEIDVYVRDGRTLVLTVVQRGDMNCDGSFDGADIDPFFLALGDPGAWRVQYPGCNFYNADVNRDGAVDGADIDVFFLCLGFGSCP